MIMSLLNSKSNMQLVVATRRAAEAKLETFKDLSAQLKSFNVENVKIFMSWNSFIARLMCM